MYCLKIKYPRSQRMSKTVPSLMAYRFADDAVGTPFPLDEGGAALGVLDSDSSLTFTFQVTIDSDILANVDETDECPGSTNPTAQHSDRHRFQYPSKR